MLYFYFDQQGGGVPKMIKKLKVYDFFVYCSIIDAKLIFTTPTYGTWCIQKGAHIQLCIVLLDFAGFLFWSAKWRNPQNIRESETF